MPSKSDCREVFYTKVRRLCFRAVYEMKLLRWDIRLPENSHDPYYDFIRKYAAGQGRISFRPEEVDVGRANQATKDWLVACGEAVSRLPRRDVCTLYVYTSTMYYVANDFLRKGVVANMYYLPEWTAQATTLAFQSMDIASYVKPSMTGSAEAVALRKAVAAGAAMKRPIPWTERTATAYFEARDSPVRKALLDAKPILSKRLFSELARDAAMGSTGIMFYAQAKDIVNEVRSLDDYLRVIPDISVGTWRKIVTKFITDMDSIIARMPVIKSLMVTYRGTQGTKAAETNRDKAYVSTSLSADQAKHFAGKRCCMQVAHLKAGGRALPLMYVSRYPVELEILLPHLKDRAIVTFKNMNSE